MRSKQNVFRETPSMNQPRSSFDRSHNHKTTFDAGKLIPIMCDEMVPGDTFNCSLNAFARLATPIHPVMDNMTLDTHFFAVPIRLLWENWERFNGAQDNPGDSIDFTIPQVEAPAGGWAEGSIGDYFGLPTKVGALQTSALFFRAYNLIYNTWYRPQEIIGSLTVNTDNGVDPDTDYSLVNRTKYHDYFTSCLVAPQRGDSVMIPIGGTAPVKGLGAKTGVFNSASVTAIETDGTTPTYTLAKDTSVAGNDDALYVERQAGNIPNIRTNLDDITNGGSINELREAYQIQRLLERDARGGTRYTEIIKSHFSVTSPDFRLQRPEYIGGGSAPVNITPIAQTSSTDVTTPQGNLAAMGTVGVKNHGFVYSATEHCVIIGLASVRANLTYQQCINRMHSRKTRLDFYIPALQNLGEQAVLSKELFCDGTSGDEDVFGYQERWAEMKYKPSQVTGLFRSNAVASLDSWHLAEDFSVRPTLSPGFINNEPPIDRVIAVPAEPHFILDMYFKLICARPMPMYSIPGMSDHF